LLDEPTNHLDFISENILIQALQQYQGTFVVVSHNRHFVNQVANKIWYIEDHQIKEYPGTYDEYEYWRKKNEAVGIIQPVAVKKSEPKPAEKVQNIKPVNVNEKKIKSLSQDLKKVEEVIQKLELEKKKIEDEMAKPEVYSNFEKLNEIQQKFDALNATLQGENSRWEKIMLELDALETAV